MSEVSDITTLQVPNYAKWMRERQTPNGSVAFVVCRLAFPFVE